MNRRELMRVLGDMVRDIPTLVDVIAPFGFESLAGWNLAEVKPKRMYLYVLPRGGDLDQTAEEIVAWLGAWRASIASALDSAPLSFVSVDNRRLVTVFDPDGGLGCFVYFVYPGSKSLIDCYGEYVAMLPLAIASGELNEMRHFAESPSSRRFVFQSARMFAGSHLFEMSEEHARELISAARRNGSHEIPTTARAFTTATADDKNSLNSIVVPAATSLTRMLRDGPRLDVSWVDIHGGNHARFSVNIDRVRTVSERVVAAYEDRRREG